MDIIIYYGLILILIIILSQIIQKKKIEKFASIDNDVMINTVETKIIGIYYDILKRQPKSDELRTEVIQINSGELTYDGLRRKLIDSDEYHRLIKLQSNELVPELPKMIADRDLVNKISNIYFEQIHAIIPVDLIYPLRDIYIYLN